MSGLIWLASYPKSGNTWLRLLLRELSAGAGQQAVLASADDSVIASSRELFERVTGLVSSELQPAEIDALRPAVYRHLARSTDRPVWLKVHDSYDSAAIGGLDFPLDCSLAVIYLLRDPRDVCVSLAHHLGVTIDQALSMMGNDQLSLNRQGVPLPEQFAQWLGRWDRHVQAWLERCPMTPLCLRYEDLLQDTAASLRRVLAWTAQTADEEAIGRAIERCRFSRLAAEEARSGFAERPRQSVRFFRSGRAGGWRDTLTVSQAARIESEFGPLMRRMGYLDGEGAA